MLVIDMVHMYHRWVGLLNTSLLWKIAWCLLISWKVVSNEKAVEVSYILEFSETSFRSTWYLSQQEVPFYLWETTKVNNNKLYILGVFSSLLVVIKVLRVCLYALNSLIICCRSSHLFSDFINLYSLFDFNFMLILLTASKNKLFT